MHDSIGGEIIFIERMHAQLVELAVHRIEISSLCNSIIIPANRLVRGAAIGIDAAIRTMIDGKIVS